MRSIENESDFGLSLFEQLLHGAYFASGSMIAVSSWYRIRVNNRVNENGSWHGDVLKGFAVSFNYFDRIKATLESGVQRVIEQIGNPVEM